MKMKGTILQAILLLTIFIYAIPCYSVPLSTSNRWIIDARTRQRVKLACINWPSHIGPMLAEGLDKKSLNFIISEIVKYQFNCIRFTWATYMFTRAQYAKLTVEQSFDKLNLTEAKSGIVKHNPFLLRMTILQAFDTIVDAFGSHNLMVILDNHISQPVWCCSENDGNGFQGDPQFHPEEWIRGLTTVSKRYKSKYQVIGIGMRNELRGPRQNQTVWYNYIQEAAAQIHQLNPNVLVIASGLDYATNLSFLKEKPLEINLDNKLVLEAHVYSWSDQPINVWVEQSVNQACANEINIINEKVGFVNTGENPLPLFFGEFGVDEKNLSQAEDRFLSCFLAYAADRDLDWGLWALQGSYYERDGQPGAQENFGILNANWVGLKNPNLQKRLRLVKARLQDGNTNSSPSSSIMYHPQSGSCVHTNRKKEIYATNCKRWRRWTHDGEEAPIRMMGGGLCMKAAGDGLPPIISTDCSSQQSIWRPISSSKLHLAAKDEKGQDLCLHMDMESSIPTKIVTRKCICVENDPNCKDDPTSQWFKLVQTNINE